jgi:hypothetical protein
MPWECSTSCFKNNEPNKGKLNKQLGFFKVRDLCHDVAILITPPQTLQNQETPLKASFFYDGILYAPVQYA